MRTDGGVTSGRSTEPSSDDVTVAHGGPSVARPAPPHAAIGRRLGKYRVTGVLGVGGMGVVFRAVDGDLEREVALKVLSPEHDDGGEVTRQESARLSREARAQAQLSHPNVVVVYDVGNVKGEVYLAMELVEGPSLRAWLDERSRGWRELLPVFLDAGAGLEAAHAAGLVHRDFKPANVLIGLDGRPRVSDFGLARPLRELSQVSDPGSEAGASWHGDEALTVDGMVVGTPAYMAPEQHAGQPLTPAVDQYAFCMALWEALAGRHPMRGLGFAELVEAKRRGPPVPPAGSDVPPWLWRVLARGLAVAPGERFASMAALRDALRRGGSSWRPWMGAVAAAAVAAAVLGWWLPAEPSPCRIDETALRGRWDGDAREAVRQAFEASGRSYAHEGFERVAGSLDELGAAWLVERRAACEATHVRGEQDEATLDRRMACLDEAADAIGRVVEVLRQADAATVDRASAVLASLPDLARCADVESLAARGAVAPGHEAEAQALQAELVGVRARVSAGRFAEALSQADDLNARVEAVGSAALTAEHASVHAKALEGLARPVEAQVSLQRAYAAAGEAGNDRLAAQVAVWIAWNVGVHQSRAREGLDWVRTAEASLARVGDDPALLADILNTRGALETDLGNVEAARDALTNAIALVEARVADDEPRLAGLLVNLAILEGQRGEHPVAEALQRRALAIRERVQGRDHPETAAVLNNLANTLVALERHDEALAANDDALARIARTYGPSHPLVATFRVARATLLYERGERGPAAEELRAAAEVFESTLGADHRDLMIIHNNLGQVLLEDGQPEPARRAFERALSVAQVNDLYERANAMPALVGLARALTELGQDELALRRWDEALPRIDAGQTDVLDELPRAFRSAAELYARTGDPERAAGLRAKAEAWDARSGAPAPAE